MPEPAFTLPGIRVHDALEWMFTFGWNLRSRCPGIRIPSAVMVLRILHPIFASTLCAAKPLARIAEPTIAL